MKKCLEKLRTMQRAVERAMLGVSLRDNLINEEIQRRIKLVYKTQGVTELKWRWTEYVRRQNSDLLVTHTNKNKCNHGYKKDCSMA